MQVTLYDKQGNLIRLIFKAVEKFMYMFKTFL